MPTEFLPIPADQSGAWDRCSASSCADLGWERHPRGDFYICGGTITNGNTLNDGGCFGQLSYYDSDTQCEANGARLCTAQEVLDDEPTGTGCSFDNELVWSQS